MKILLADDHTLFREGLCYVLRDLAEDVSVLEAENFTRALEIAGERADLDLILVDLVMPDMDAFAGLEALKEKRPEVPIVVVSASEDRRQIMRAIDVGASGYLPKSMSSKIVISALRLVLSGGVYLPPSLLRGPREAGGRGADRSRSPGGLTPRQLEVLRLLAEGKSNKEIAAALDISEGTVKLHVTALLKALGASNRTEAAVKAAEYDLGADKIRAL